MKTNLYCLSKYAPIYTMHLSLPLVQVTARISGTL